MAMTAQGREPSRIDGLALLSALVLDGKIEVGLDPIDSPQG